MSSIDGKYAELLVSNWIRSNLFLLKIEDSLPFTMKSIKNFDRLSGISDVFFKNPNFNDLENLSNNLAMVFISALEEMPQDQCKEWFSLILPEANKEFFASIHFLMVISLLNNKNRLDELKETCLSACCNSSEPLKTQLEMFLEEYAGDKKEFTKKFNQNRTEMQKKILATDFQEVYDKFLAL